MATSTVLELSRQDLARLPPPPDAHITDVEHLASYNWIESTTPTIAVPGCPPVWSNVKLPKRLKKDTGNFYIAQNQARHPESPLEPLFRALYIENPSFDMRKIYVVSDRTNIRKLLSFIEPKTSKNELESFTIKAEAVGETVLFCRDEAKVEEFIGPNDFRGFGRQFEKEYTENQVTGSTGHHRIVSFRINSLSLVIRHETDGYLDSHSRSDSATAQDDVLDMLKSLSLNPDPPASTNDDTGSKMTIIKTGRQVTLASTLEIKTRVAHKPMSFDEVAPQLWVSQTPNLVRAYHVKGVFRVPAVEDVTENLKRWEDRNQNALKILVATIQRIAEVTKEHGRVTIQYHDDGGKLTISRADTAPNMLPEYLYIKLKDPRSVEDGFDETRKLCKEKEVIASPAIGSTQTPIRVGYDLFNIPLHSFPYLKAFVETHSQSLPPGTELKHDSIPLFEVALEGVVSGYRRCFRMLDVDVDLFQQLCSTYSFLNVDVLGGQSLEDIIMNIKAGKTDYGSEVRRDKRLARDSAFRLVYGMLRKRFPSDGQDGNKLYNAVLYIVSHPATFKHKAKSVVRAVYVSQSQHSTKQAAQLHEWVRGEDSEDDSGTTPSPSPSHYYDSDECYISD